MLAPIALYPDALLAQMLMAASYPLEVVEAARWSQANPALKGDAALAAVKDESWDVSVKSLTAFPQVLAMMNSKLDWTQKIGDAMIAQQSDVAASVQRLRAQAVTAGNLKTTPQQTVTTQPAPASSTGAPADTTGAIVIEPANPDTIYVPSYNPSWAYGTWPYPAYPPTYFPPPPGYGYGAPLMGGFMFGFGFAAGAALFGGWRWGGGWGGGWRWGGWGRWGGNSYTTVNINRVTRITNNYNRDHDRDGHWEHDPAHRHGVPYRDHASREKYGQHRPDAAQRQAFRGKIDSDPHGGENRGGENRGGENRGGENRGGENRGGENRGGENRGGENRGYENRGHAFSGVDRGRQVNHEAARGHSYSGRSFHGGGARGGGFHGGGHGGRR